ncbi:MAG: hypothetical protein WC378_00755 [Opitutaceae bacterium]|jgi:hypothetical protein
MKPIVNLVFPADNCYYSDYGFNTAETMRQTLESLAATSSGRFFHSQPDKQWIATRLLDRTVPRAVMVFLIHEGDWDSCFNAAPANTVVVDLDYGVSVPPKSKWWLDRFGHRVLPQDFANSINSNYCASHFERISFVTFHRPGPDWFKSALMESGKQKTVRALLTAVELQVPIWGIAHGFPKMRDMRCLCAGYFADVTGSTRKAKSWRTVLSPVPSWEVVNKEWDMHWQNGQEQTLPEQVKRLLDVVGDTNLLDSDEVPEDWVASAYPIIQQKLDSVGL